MKKAILSLIMVVTIMISNSAKSQSYAELGRGSRDVESVVKILVVDDENSRPISGAVIKLLEGSNRIFQIKTDNNGIAVIIIRDWIDERDIIDGMLNVRDSEYRYDQWEGDFDRVHGYSRKQATRQFLVSSHHDRLDVWMDRETVPSNFEIYRKITNEGYISHKKGKACHYDLRGNGYDPPYGTPALFEINVRLNYQRHSRDTRVYSKDGREYDRNLSKTKNNSSSSIFINVLRSSYDSPPGTWEVDKNDEDEIHFFHTGPGETIKVRPAGDREWNVRLENFKGTSLPLKDPYHSSIESAISLAYQLMNALGK